MAKKLKKFASGTTGRRSGEKFRRAAWQFDKAMIACVILVIIATAVAATGDFSLREPSVNGFAVNFLWLPAALPLLIADGIAACLGGALPEHGIDYIYVLGACDLILAAAVWSGVRIAAIRKQSGNILRTARTFLLIIIVWGIFQLLCCGIKFAGDRSNLDDALTEEITADRK